tara:strand:+ start:1301 stop:1705 length:405 start_codon:yes stop_codon:yes gene_type:complete
MSWKEILKNYRSETYGSDGEYFPYGFGDRTTDDSIKVVIDVGIVSNGDVIVRDLDEYQNDDEYVDFDTTWKNKSPEQVQAEIERHVNNETKVNNMADKILYRYYPQNEDSNEMGDEVNSIAEAIKEIESWEQYR